MFPSCFLLPLNPSVSASHFISLLIKGFVQVGCLHSKDLVFSPMSSTLNPLGSFLMSSQASLMWTTDMNERGLNLPLLPPIAATAFSPVKEVTCLCEQESGQGSAAGRHQFCLCPVHMFFLSRNVNSSSTYCLFSLFTNLVIICSIK